MGLPDGQKVLR